MLRFVTATRLDLAAFKAQSALCRSLMRVSVHSTLRLDVFEQNTQSLGWVFNRKIEEAGADETLVFIHDDVWIDDWRIGLRLEEAFGQFDVVGVVGNRRRTPRQQAWWWHTEAAERDWDHLAGSIAHGTPEKATVDVCGPAPAAVKLLDGVMLAARASTLKNSGVRFDPAFAFHFYDMDFCRRCEAAGLRLGVWPIAITHESSGPGVNSEPWQQAYDSYLLKWQT